MKRVIGFILLAVFTVFFASQGFAQSEATTDKQDVKQTTATTTDYGKFVDKDGDGVCDNFEALGDKAGKGCNFVDANGDGICDHHADGTCLKGNQNCCKGQGANCGKGQGQKNRNGCGGPCGAKTAPDKK
jgi:hypothetical protein